MDDDFLGDIPTDDPPMSGLPAQAGEGKIELRSMNANIGAVRVAVPRNMATVLMRIDQAAQVSGDRWKYAMPFKNKKKGTTELVTGPTVGCALDIARAYGNCNVDVEKVEETSGGWVFHGVFLDIETGFRLGRPFRQRRDQNTGGYGGDSSRNDDVIFQIGASKAIRNVTVNALRGVVDEALDRAANRMTDKIARNRDKIVERVMVRLDELNVEPARVERFFGRKFEDMKPVHIAQVIKMLQAVADDLVSVDDCFPKTGQAVGGEHGIHEVRDSEVDKGEGQGEPQQAKPAPRAGGRQTPPKERPQTAVPPPPPAPPAPPAAPSEPDAPQDGDSLDNLFGSDT